MTFLDAVLARMIWIPVALAAWGLLALAVALYPFALALGVVEAVRRAPAAAALVLGLVLAGGQAAASCGPSEQIEMRLASLDAEVPVGAGMKRDQFGRSTVIRVWVSETGTFTITESSPQGVTCLLMSGKEFYLGPPNFPKPGDPG